MAVWVAERFSEPHLAAVEFLNRTSDESVGYALVTVKLAPAPDGEHYVDFRVAARPNLWLKSRPDPRSHVAAPERVDMLTAVHELIEQPLLEAGWHRVNLHGPRSARIELHLPEGHPLRPATYFTLRASREDFRFRHIAHRLDSFQHSRAVVTALRDRYGQRLAALVPEGTKIEWGVDTGTNQRNDQWYAEHPDGGHRDLTPVEAADWAIAVAAAWVRLLQEDPPLGVIEAAVPTGEADVKT